MRFSQRTRERERGNILLVSFLMVTLLTALATAHFATVQKNSRQSDFLNSLGDLRRYAETGVHLAVHELTYAVGGGDGNIGTDSWVRTSGDWGRDGTMSTYDEGEGDGIPTPGEPGLIPAAIGNPVDGMGLLVRTEDSAWAGVKRIVSTAFNTRAMAIIEVCAQEAASGVPGVGAVYLQPHVALDLKGNSFLIDGHDTNPNNTPGPEPTVHGISTTIGDPPGSNASDMVDQIPDGREDQVIGLGTNPSVGETDELDFEKVYNGFKAARTNVVPSGTYSDPNWGNASADDYQVTYCSGDLHLTGNGQGAGVLVVEGSLTISGSFTWVGIVICRGDARLKGGGGGINLYGSLMLGQTLTAIDPDPDLGVIGNAKLHYSSVGLAKASGLLGSSYSVVYWNVIK